MKKSMLLVISLLTYCSVFAQSVKFDTLSLDQAFERAKAEGKFVFVDVTASWCGPCQLMLEEVLSRKDVGEFCNKQFICIQMDVDKLEGKDFKKKYGVNSIPTFFILQEDGTVRHRLRGARRPEDFLAWAKRGVNETSSLFFLNNLLERKQKMSLQNKVDYYLVLKDIRKLHDADSLRTVLFEQTPFEKLTDKDDVIESNGYMNPYSNQLIESKNIILRGAPGTGKSYLAKEIAADIISNGYFDNYTLLTDEQKKQIEFVQFHPSYDYSDFVEGLRPKVNNDGSIGFELRDGIFKKFVARAKKNYINAISKQEELKKYIFIIDEINRGEISKIFGELFFSIDPGYRGVAGEVSTQYSNLHKNPDEKFFIPDNVYIIGTMNDIDRSVDSFDFAMRRRFRFIEIKADERLEMLDVLGEKKEEAIRRMTALNNEIAKVEDLNENYHIGGAYFLKLKTLNFDKLWSDYLKPLLQDYVRGMYDEDIIMKKFERAYLNVLPKVGDGNDGIQD